MSPRGEREQRIRSLYTLQWKKIIYEFEMQADDAVLAYALAANY
jgi:hypothetical protein